MSNFFSGRAFPNRADISSAIGSFAVGFLGNLYGKFTRGSPFVVMVPGCVSLPPSPPLPPPPLEIQSPDARLSAQCPRPAPIRSQQWRSAQIRRGHERHQHVDVHARRQRRLYRLHAVDERLDRVVERLPDGREPRRGCHWPDRRVRLPCLARFPDHRRLTLSAHAPSLFVSAAVVNILGGGRRRGTNLSSF